MIIGLIVALVAAVVVTTAVVASQLSKSGKSADKKFSKKKVAKPQEDCPLKDKKLIEVEWSPKKAMCGDDVSLKATAKNYPDNTDCSGEALKEGSSVASLKVKGENTFPMPWKVKDVVFKGDSMPEKYDLLGKASALGETVQTEKPLEIKRLADQADTAISWHLTSGIYGWDAAFRINVAKGVINVKQTLQVKKAWLGKWVSFDNTLDGRSGWGWVKKVGPTWKFWDTSATPKVWRNLPRAISLYTVNKVVFIKSGTKFVDRGNASNEWPEAFAEPSNYASKKADWLSNIHSVWDNKFKLKRKDCPSSSDDCCSWGLRFKVNWSDSAGDKLVYAIWAQEWERSNASDWYLTENRLGVAGHECGHLLGAYDEYTGGAVDTTTNTIDADSIMGQNLTSAKERHLNEMRDKMKGKINGWTGKSWDFEIKKK